VKRIVTVVLAAALLYPGIAFSADRSAPREPATAVAAAGQPRKLDINRATMEELVGVPGIGSNMAKAIVGLRSKKGSFSKIDELLEVRGIKEKKLAALSEYLTVVAPTPSNPTPSALQPR
jgi:competence ComEA-like helix-hairpin-helix protein